MSAPKKKGSQFAGAAAMFRKKENDLLKKQTSLSPMSPMSSSPRPSSGARSSMSNALLSPVASKPKAKRSSLMPPSFVSPGLRTSEAYPANWSKSPRLSESGIGALPFTPSPVQTGKKKVNAKSWKDSLSFQAPSPQATKKKSVSASFSTPHYGGSYMNNASTAARPRKSEVISPMEQTPDIKIQVTIPDIDKKMRLRKARSRPPPKKQEENVPEHIRKYREREANRKRAEELKMDKAATKLQAYVLGWKARAVYPRLLKDNRERMRKNKEKQERIKCMANSAIKIQKTFRGYVRRTRYLYVLECKRRREENLRETKRIEKQIQRVPKQTKLDIKELKKEYVEKKKELKRTIRKLVREEEDKLVDIKRSGMNLVKYQEEENQKLKDNLQRYRKESKVLVKQFDLLSQKSDEIASNFQSLQNFVQRKNTEIQKHEMASQKCRHRYLPQYRKETSDRNRHCIAEVRVKILYKARLHRIVSELEYNCRDPEIVQDAQQALQSCEAELEAMPDILVPDGLWDYLNLK